MSCCAPSSRQSEVIRQPSMPQGTTHSNGCRSLLTLTANPCVVTPRLTCTPMEPTFLPSGGSPPTQTPVRPSITSAPTPYAASEPIINRSSFRTYSCTLSPYRFRETIG